MPQRLYVNEFNSVSTPLFILPAKEEVAIALYEGTRLPPCRATRAGPRRGRRRHIPSFARSSFGVRICV